jgi:integrase
MERHSILGGMVQLYQRPNSSYWQCSASVGGKQRRGSTRTDSLTQARDIATDWYLTLMGKDRAGLLVSEKTFSQAAEQFLKEYTLITEGQRSVRWVEGHGIRLRLHLVPFFGTLGLSQVTPGKVQEYRMHRIATSSTGKAPARSTIHDEIVTLRQTLKTAIRHGWLTHLPDLSQPYRTQGKVVHRPWFSPAEYKQLYEATREYAQKPFHGQFKWNAEQLHDFVLFLASTGLRPDEAKNLQHRDVSVVRDDATGERILEIEVRGKRGVGFCKSMPGAVRPYHRLRARPLPTGPSQTPKARRRRGELGEPPLLEIRLPQPTDHVFPGNHIKLFNGVLRRASLKADRDGNRRTAYSLRHT